MSEHECRSGERCRKRWRDDASPGRPLRPATTMGAFTLCESCRVHLKLCLVEVPLLWSHLRAILDYLGPAGGQRFTRSVNPQVVINVHTDALMGELVDAVERAAEVVHERLGVWPDPAGDQQARLERDVRVLAERLPVLLSVDPLDVLLWSPDGESFDTARLDGVDLALRLIDVVGRARARLGVTRGRDRMPVPCPMCEHDTLGIWHGSDSYDCTNCFSSWTRDEYRQMVLVLSDDYRELTP